MTEALIDIRVPQCLGATLIRAATANDTAMVDETIRAWRLTVELLEDRTAVARINEALDENYEELPRPLADD